MVFDSEQVKIIKAKNKNVLFIDEDVVTETINSCNAILAPKENQLKLH